MVHQLKEGEMNRTRDQFTMSSLCRLVRGVFSQHNQDRVGRYKISTTDCLMSAFALFSLKYPSLLQFDKELSHEKALRHNLGSLFGIKHIPCDTQMRERLDGLSFTNPRIAMKSVLARLQRAKVLEQWQFMGHYLVSLDGTGFFSSSQIHCPQCCEKHHRNGTTTYSHQMVVGSIVHPSLRQVLPIGFEPIVKSDGQQKNDCERNASKRWLAEFRRQHPQLPTIIVADGLSANAPFIKLLEHYRCHYILVCQKDDHKYLWDWFWKAEKPDVVAFEETVEKIHKSYRFMENVPLNESSDRLVTVVFYQETHPKGRKISWGWITDLPVTAQNVREIVKGARTRWKIENETFNTLKNQDYHFEHNYGHGLKTLSNVLAGLMLLAFLIDQCLEAVNLEFQKALKKMGQRIRLWYKLRSGFQWLHIETWEKLYASILDPPTFNL